MRDFSFLQNEISILTDTLVRLEAESDPYFEQLGDLIRTFPPGTTTLGNPIAEDLESILGPFHDEMYEIEKQLELLKSELRILESFNLRGVAA